MTMGVSGSSGMCGCWTCEGQRRASLPFPQSIMRPLIVCSTCGNKRCQKATHHDNSCTGNNEPEQTGIAATPGGDA